MIVRKADVREAVQRFPSKLMMAREAMGMSQTDVARAGQFAPSAISHFEAGRRIPTLANLFKLCRVLRCRADDLLSIR